MKNQTKPALPRKQISLRIPPEIHEGVASIADKQHRSIHAQILYVLEQHIDKEAA